MGAWSDWNYAAASWCRRRRGNAGIPPHEEGEIQTRSHCRQLSMAGDAGPKVGHEACEPLFTSEGVGALLGIDEEADRA